MNEKFRKLGFYPADILLPKDADMTKWAVVACDQFTSQPEYWQAVEETVGDAPSTLRLILPEAKLNDPDVDAHIADINGAMNRYLAEGVFQTLPGSLFYIERTQSDGKVRHGLIGMVDLDQYDFTPGSGALIRATEGTVLSRIPPRVRVRQDAPIELPHVMLLIDDPDRTVIEPLTAGTDTMEKLYDFDLQQGGGHLKGWKLTDAQMDAVADALAAMCTPEAMKKKYGLKDAAPLLFAVGDGNHSLATAKQCYENLKKVTPESEWAALPARYALVEVVNNHDDATSLGHHLSKPSVYREFKRIAAAIGRPDARFHDLRHSFAVASLRAGDDPKTVQSNLGHATAAFTLDVYGHMTDQMKQASSARMEAFIKGLSAM